MTLRSPQLPKTKSFSTVAALTLFSLCTLPVTVFAETVATEEWNISADKIIRYEDPQSVVAEGNIILVKRQKLPPPVKEPSLEVTDWAELLGEDAKTAEVKAEEIDAAPVETMQTTVTIKADWMVYDTTLQSIKARGHVRVDNGEEILNAEQASLDLTKETGTFTNATVVKNDNSLHLEGRTIEKTGINTYNIGNGWVITCKLEKGETPPWSFASKSTKIEPGGYAVLKHARFNIRGVPVFYTPYMVLPVKNTRQTGLLYPEFSTSNNNGFGLNLPFFLNISDSADATFYPQYYVNRGFMPGAEFRYAQGEMEKGTFVATYIDDKLTDPSETGYYQDTHFTHTNNERYWIRGKADHTFGEDWQTRLDLDIVSDRDYLTEFNTGTNGFNNSSERFLNEYGRAFDDKTSSLRSNSLGTLKSWSGMSLEGNLLAINDVRTVKSGSTPLWKLPSVDFSGYQPIGESDFSFDWNTDYVNYWREKGVGGHRFDLHPILSSPIPLSRYLESRAQIGVRDTYYLVNKNGDSTWTNDDQQNRLLADFQTEVGTTLLKNFFQDASQNNGFDHQVRPYISYEFLPDVDQDKLPIFDEVDSISDQNRILYGIDNFFNLFSNFASGNPSTREYAFFKINQYYDLRSTASDKPFSDFFVRTGWLPIDSLTLEYQTDIDAYGAGFQSHSFGGTYTTSRGDYFSLDYSFNDEMSIEQVNGTVSAHLLDNWLAAVEVQHSLSYSETQAADISLTYQALCWSVTLESNYTPTDTAFMLIFNLANIGSPLGIGL
ncbi:MAG: LPS assembly protein LptD [Desulfoprunum sp.]|nr:LPS assembly protein LptD [Desulfoprunum sp.]